MNWLWGLLALLVLIKLDEGTAAARQAQIRALVAGLTKQPGRDWLHVATPGFRG